MPRFQYYIRILRGGGGGDGARSDVMSKVGRARRIEYRYAADTLVVVVVVVVERVLPRRRGII